MATLVFIRTSQCEPWVMRLPFGARSRHEDGYQREECSFHRYSSFAIPDQAVGNLTCGIENNELIASGKFVFPPLIRSNPTWNQS